MNVIIYGLLPNPLIYITWLHISAIWWPLLHLQSGVPTNYLATTCNIHLPTPHVHYVIIQLSH